jgi:hypothetical protein
MFSVKKAQTQCYEGEVFTIKNSVGGLEYLEVKIEI